MDRTLFVDCVVVAGHNPAVMLIKELVESKQLTGYKADFALSALGYYVKTPTSKLLHELVVRLILSYLLMMIYHHQASNYLSFRIC